MNFYRLRHKPTGLFWNGGKNIYWSRRESTRDLRGLVKVGKAYPSMGAARNAVKNSNAADYGTECWEIVEYESAEKAVHQC